MNKKPPSGLYRCSECGRYRGEGVACDCDNAWCSRCGERLSRTPFKSLYEEKDGQIWHVAHFGATCPKCGPLFAKYGGDFCCRSCGRKIDGKEHFCPIEWDKNELKINEKAQENWTVNRRRFLLSEYKHNAGEKVFKFCYKPETGDILFDKRPTSHKKMIINYGDGKFDAWVWGICLWEKKTLYLRGLSETVKLLATRKMLEKSCLPAGFKVLWGIEAKKNLLEKDLRGL
jgi:hypothetical protein